MFKKAFVELQKYKEQSEIKKAYFDYLLMINKKHIVLIILIVAFFNCTLLIPDINFIDNTQSKLLIILFRTVFSLTLILFSFNIKIIKSFNTFSKILTFLELFEIFIFLFVLNQYNPPDFLIQTLGLLIIIIAVFLFPNRWKYMLGVSISSVVGFLICSYLTITDLNYFHFSAGAVYLAIATLLCAIFAFNTEKHQFNEFAAKSELIRINSIDLLTKAANRYKLAEEADKWVKYCKRYNQPLSLVLFDIDNFKKINDEHGHNYADNVLIELVNLMMNKLLSSDVLARWGGDEFILLLPNTDKENAFNLSERLRKEIENFHFNENIMITCSFGVVGMKEYLNLDSMIEEADNTMYSAKKLGGNKVLVF